MNITSQFCLCALFNTPEQYLAADVAKTTYLDQNLPFKNLRGRQPLGFMNVDTGQIQFVLQHLLQILSHLFLLRHSAVVLYGQDHWVPGGAR